MSTVFSTPPPLPGGTTNPRAPLVHTARVLSPALTSGTGGTPVIQTEVELARMALPVPGVQGGAWAEYQTMAEGDGAVNFNLFVPDLNLLVPSDPRRRFRARFANVKVFIGSAAYPPQFADLVHQFYLEYANAGPATIDCSAVISLDLGPRVIGRQWTVVIDAASQYFIDISPWQTQRPITFLHVTCELPVAVGTRGLATAP